MSSSASSATGQVAPSGACREQLTPLAAAAGLDPAVPYSGISDIAGVEVLVDATGTTVGMGAGGCWVCGWLLPLPFRSAFDRSSRVTTCGNVLQAHVPTVNPILSASRLVVLTRHEHTACTRWIDKLHTVCMWCILGLITIQVTVQSSTSKHAQASKQVPVLVR
jgi:hypothetical protein